VSQPAPSAPRLLRRSREDRVIAGVCGGLGRYLGIDPVLLRIAFVVLALVGGGGVLLYLVSWILIPEERPGEELGAGPPSSADTLRLVIGGLLVIVGVLLLVQMSVPRIGRYVWPLALIAVGVAVLVQASVRR
jgi:phage shock protein C